MQCALNNRKVLMILLSLMSGVTVPATAQLNSRSAQITLIARMPETLGVTLNIAIPGSPGVVPDTTSGAEYVGGVTISWNLDRGRSQVSTVASFERKDAPIQVAMAIGNSVIPFDGLSREGTFYSRLVLPRTVSRMVLHDTNLASLNRLWTRTVLNLDLRRIGNEQPLLVNDVYMGTIKIEVQAIL
jgi:hypothetical protein